MEFTFLTLLIVVTIFVIIASLFLQKGSILDSDSIIGILIIAAISGLIITCILSWVLPDVTVVTNNGKTFEHNSKIIIGSYKEKSLSFFNSYIDNQTDKELILYPIVYTKNNNDQVSTDKKEIVFKLKSVKEVEKEPDFYFEKVPNQISVNVNIFDDLWNLITGKETEEIEWSLEVNTENK